MPLVLEGHERGDARVTARQQRARKVRPQYSEGELIRVAGARHQAEAEFIQGLLLEEGIPSMLRRSSGFDVPDMLAAGPRDVLVPATGVEAAREVLLQSGVAATLSTSTGVDSPFRVALFVLALVVAVAVVVLLGSLLV
jgi:hypothetical protein